MPSNSATEAYFRYAKARDEAGLTDYKVCKACGFGTTVTTSWKKGTYKPKWDRICKIAEVIGADPVWIDKGVRSVLMPPGMVVSDAQDYDLGNKKGHSHATHEMCATQLCHGF